MQRLNLCAIGLALLFGIGAYRGADLVAFERVASPLIGERSAQRISPIDVSLAPFIASFLDVPGAAERARELRLAIVLRQTPNDRAAVEEAISAIAERSPTSTPAWLALAEARSARAAPIEDVLAAFRMSALTGSHEGYLMTDRAIFGLEHWAELPEQDRRTVIRDLATSVPQLGADRPRSILGEKSAPEREAIRSALVASGLASPKTLSSLGM
ncbi:MAG TPA: hypothetical protein VH684_14585 [Xanthobacteraceae bacterium]|jgi:hypothetical protein